MKKLIQSFLIIGAAILILVSTHLPYWQIRIKAPQYPKGLVLQVYTDHLQGDVSEIDMLNHYIGMKSLNKGARLERKIATPGTAAIAILRFVSLFLRKRWRSILLLPAFSLPFIFATDLYLWMRHFGLHLDPKAPLSKAVKPFIPPLFGEGKIAQFNAVASFEEGFYMSALASFIVLMLILVILRERALLPAQKKSESCCKIKFSKAASIAFLLLSVGAPLQAGTLQDRVDQAPEHDTVYVEKGVYPGPVEIKKPVRLMGEEGAVIDGGGKGTVIRVLAPEVTVRGFVIRNSGSSLTTEDAGILVKDSKATIENNQFENVLFGIYLRHAHDSIVRGNVLRSKDLPLARRGDLIRAWYSDRLRIEKNKTDGGRDVVLWYSKDSVLKGNSFRRGRYALHFMYCARALVANNQFEENTVGAYLMYSADLRVRKNRIVNNRGVSGYGLGLKDMENAVIEENVIADNSIGAFLDQASGTYYGNVFAFNRIGVEMLPSAQRNVFMGNSFIENGEQLTVAGQGLDQNKNQWIKNFWSDYRGYDANRDGIGDFPYQSKRIFERFADRDSNLKFFYSSPMIQALEFASAIFPVFAPQPKLRDEKPLMKPVFPVLAGEKPALSWPGMMVSGSFFLPLMLLFLSNRNFHKVPPPLMQLREVVPYEVDSAIRIASLSKHYGKTRVLNGLDLDVARGETVVLWGPNGAGKTTALHCLLGLVAFEGTAHVLGEDVRKQGKKVRELVGYVPQEIRFHQEQTVLESVFFFARIRKVSSQRAKDLLNEWGLEGFEKRKVYALSGGMKQKLALVIALLSDPPVLLLDEPTSNLDLHTRHELLCLLEKLKHSGKTILLSSHHLSEVWKLADRVIVLEHGQKVREGKPEDVKENLGASVLLFLTVPHEHCQLAAAKIRSQGFLVEPNGTQLLVQVPIDRKAEPFRMLAEASIPILDFDFENAGGQKEKP